MENVPDTTAAAYAAPTDDPAVTERLSSSWQSIWLIAKREIQARLAQPSFRIMTLVMLAAVIGGVFLANNLIQSTSEFRVGVLDQAATYPITTAADATGLTVVVVPVANLETGSNALRAGELAAVVIGDPFSDPQVQVLTESVLNPQLNAMFHQIAQQAAFAREITALGGDPLQVATDLAAAQVSITSLNPPPVTDAGQLIVAMVMGVLLYMAMQVGGQYVAQGVVEEKASRVVEVLLSTVPPWQLLAGKIIGIGIITLGQLFLVLGGAYLAAEFTGLVGETNLHLGATLVWSIIWALVGFVTFSVVMAALAARVSRQEEIGSVITPVVMLMLIPYILGVSVLPNDPTNQLAAVLSYLPLMAPMLMPIRVALGVATIPQLLLSLLISLAALPVLLWLATKIYQGAILHTGGRISMRDALTRAS